MDSLEVTISDLDHLLAGGLILLSIILAFGRPPSASDAATRLRFYRQAWLTGAGMAALALFVWQDAGRPIEKFALQNWTGEQPSLTLAVGAIWTLVASVAVRSSASGAARAKLSAIYSHFRALMPQTRKELYGSWGAAISAGFGEEIAYRGFLLWYVSELAGLAVGVVVTSLAFGIAHGYQRRLGVAFAIFAGLLLAYVYLSTGSLLLVMWVHATYNVASFTIGQLVLRRKPSC